MSFAGDIKSLLALKAGFGTVLGCITVRLGLLLRMHTSWSLYGAGGLPSPPGSLATPSQLIDFAVMREFCLGMTVASSLPLAGHQTLVRHTPTNNSAGRPWGKRFICPNQQAVLVNL